MRDAGRIHRLRADERIDLLCDEAFVPERARTLELLLPRAAARLGDDATVGRGNAWIAEQRPGARHRQEHLGRRRPLVAENVFDSSDRALDRRNDRKAGRGETDRKLEHVREAPRPEVTQQQEPPVERPRDDGRKEAGPGNRVEAELLESFDRRCCGRSALRTYDLYLATRRVVHDRRQVAARAVQVRLDDLECEPRSNRRIECIPAALEHGHSRGGREPVRGRDHPERSTQLGTRRKAHRRDSSVPVCSTGSRLRTSGRTPTRASRSTSRARPRRAAGTASSSGTTSHSRGASPPPTRG